MKIHRFIGNAPIFILAVTSFIVLTTTCSFAQAADSSVIVHIVTDEADAVLSILEKKKSDQVIMQQDWQRLFSSEAYIRLKKREASMQRSFTDEEFKRFVLSDSLAGRFGILRTTLDKWIVSDISTCAHRALIYLPKGAQIRAKIYPVIKPKTNSFVFETTADPAIFLFLDPEINREQFENILAHELHHIGYANSCAALAAQISEDSTVSQNSRTVLTWIGAFGEGFAMLAAAGGPDIHPHAVSKKADRKRWDNDMKNFNADLKKVELFFLDILNNKLKPEEIRKISSSFFGIQGPWYTVGWKMAATIEKKFGREKLIDCICGPRILLPTYNQAAADYNRSGQDSLAVWSPSLIEHITK